MAFSDFRYPDVLETFGLTTESAPDLFAGVGGSAASDALRDQLAVGIRLAGVVNTEKARSECLISPILAHFWWRYRGRIGLYSGTEFVADPAAGLNGYVDFIISRSPQQPETAGPPAVVIFEAKRENLNAGMGQCVAGMVGAQRFNARHGAPADPIYGCVTTGTAWRFLQLSGAAVTLDLTEYTFRDVDKLLGILAFMVGPVPEPAAA